MQDAKGLLLGLAAGLFCFAAGAAEDFPKPYAPGCTERENSFEFVEKPVVKKMGEDRYQIAFAVRGACDVTVGIVNEKGVVIRHLGSGVLGANAPVPFQKNSLKQQVVWNGKDDLGQYVKEPGRLSVRVMLGLKPVFDKLLGSSSPKSIPGYVFGLAVAPEGAYVLYKGNGSHGHGAIRKFDLEGRYLAALVPPPANMPQEKMAGMSYVEYEKGVRTVHAPNVNETTSADAFVLPGVNGKKVGDCQTVVAGNRLLYCNAGMSMQKNPSLLHWVNTDGSTDVLGMNGRDLVPNAGHKHGRLALAPGGRQLYIANLEGSSVVMRLNLDEGKPATLFAGDPKGPGADNQRLNQPSGIDCDPQGRVYVTDQLNGRLQIFSPEGKWLKTVPFDRPLLVRVNPKTGEAYVFHAARVDGKTTPRLTKLAPFDSLKELFHVDGVLACVAAVDAWSPKPRIWMAGDKTEVNTGGAFGEGPGVTIWEDDGKTLRKIVDFNAEVRKEAGANYTGNFGGAEVGPGGKVVCDPTREELYWQHSQLFDLRTGAPRGSVKIPAYSYDDTAFDKRGFRHVHLNPGFEMPGVVRVDPSQRTFDEKARQFFCPEIPYDYGEEIPGAYCAPRKGALPARDQPGAKFFQDGIGVNMRGDVAINSNIYYVPKMEEMGKDLAFAGASEAGARGEYVGGRAGAMLSSGAFLREIMEKQKRGEEVYSIKRRPGIPAAGATVWTFDASGELRGESAATVGKHIAGVQLDEDGKLYIVTARPKMIGARHFLCGQGGTIGDPKATANAAPFTGTLVKTRGDQADFLIAKGVVPMEPAPTRLPDIIDISFPNVYGKDQWMWVEGAEWLYAGASPAKHNGCTCPTMRHHTDWYMRSFVPESYRHSIGVVDGNGNLVLHIGQYGNFDSWQGPQSKIPVGGDGIGIFVPRMVSGTDNYLAFQDWGERLAVLRLEYHSEEVVPLNAK